MSLLKSLVLLNVVQIVSSDYDSVSHLGRHADALEDASTDAHVASEWALVVNVSSINGFFWSFEAETNSLVISESLISFLHHEVLCVHEDVVLSLE